MSLGDFLPTGDKLIFNPSSPILPLISYDPGPGLIFLLLLNKSFSSISFFKLLLKTALGGLNIYFLFLFFSLGINVFGLPKEYFGAFGF